MRWYDVKLATLQKLFSADTGEIVTDDNTMPYLVAMPNAANACLNYIATTVRHIPKSIDIVQDGTGTDIKKYNLRELTADFYAVQPAEIYMNGAKVANYKFENDNILVLDGSIAGTWTVYYDAYPQRITANTSDNYELPLYPEVAELLPWFMASQLYKDDELQTATQYWNEFATMFTDIKERTRDMLSGNDEFINTKGWY